MGREGEGGGESRLKGREGKREKGKWEESEERGEGRVVSS